MDQVSCFFNDYYPRLILDSSADDFCLWAPRKFLKYLYIYVFLTRVYSAQPGDIGDTEQEEVAYCTKSGRGTRLIPEGTLHGVHFVKTPDYVQVTGVGDFTKINVPKGDSGGELDDRGANGKHMLFFREFLTDGIQARVIQVSKPPPLCHRRCLLINVVGGLLYGNSFGPSMQYHEWTSFISDTQFCFRACVGPKSLELCEHIYDEMGCYWVCSPHPLYLLLSHRLSSEHACQLRPWRIREL